MNINLGMLAYKDKIEIDEKIEYSKEDINSNIVEGLENVTVNGFLFQNEVDEYMAKLHVTGTMLLKDSITLETISKDFSFDIDDKIEENNKNSQNILDIKEFLWQNIVLEVPINYTKSDAKNLSGENWAVVDESSKKDEIDPRLAKLQDLYKGGE